MQALGLGRLGFLLVVNLFFLFLGCIMDAIPAMLIFFPVLLPIAKDLHIDRVIVSEGDDSGNKTTRIDRHDRPWNLRYLLP